MAAEYVLKEGNEDVMLCERGIRTFETAYRFTLDMHGDAGAAASCRTCRSIVDPSHAAGRRDWVQPMSLAAAAAGADGIIVEVHNEPDEAICDGPQAIADRASSPTTRSRSSASPRWPARSSARSRGRELREGRRSRRRPDRRLDRAGGAAAPRAPRSRASTPMPRDRSSARSSAGRSTAPRELGRRGGRRRRGRLLRRARSARCRRSSPRRSTASGADAVVTDVGSTKRELVAELPLGRRGASASSAAIRSPGAETAGVENARADLFEGARWYLTPTERSERRALRPPPARDRRPRRPPAGDRRRDPRPPDGDRQPSAARARQRARQPGGARRSREESERLPEVGPSFRDATRVAGANPAIWARHLRRQPRGGRATRSTPSSSRLQRGGASCCAPATPTRSSDWHARRARRPPRACSRPSWPAAPLRELRVVGRRTGPASSPRSRWRSGEAGVNIEDMALYPAADMRTGAIALWVAGAEQAERAAEIGRAGSATRRRSRRGRR